MLCSAGSYLSTCLMEQRLEIAGTDCWASEASAFWAKTWNSHTNQNALRILSNCACACCMSATTDRNTERQQQMGQFSSNIAQCHWVQIESNESKPKDNWAFLSALFKCKCFSICTKQDWKIKQNKQKDHELSKILINCTRRQAWKNKILWRKDWVKQCKSFKTLLFWACKTQSTMMNDRLNVLLLMSETSDESNNKAWTNNHMTENCDNKLHQINLIIAKADNAALKTKRKNHNENSTRRKIG